MPCQEHDGQQKDGMHGGKGALTMGNTREAGRLLRKKDIRKGGTLKTNVMQGREEYQVREEW